ncbi:MAG: galactitol-1-phosphate 5-dehydrogenase [Acidobacteria bacterium]|nr:galactitol-1-phosphate 5-dehydrogenase [Acidobacteriota bacterium]
MKALLLKEYMNLEVTDFPEPEIGPEDILVRVRACGICGSDIHGIDGSTGRRIPPLVMGHEAAGVVAKLGSQVEGWAEGDRITFDSMISCGKCDFCTSGHRNLCNNRMVLGVSCGDYRRHGAFAEYVAVPARICYKLPDALPYEHAALIEAVSVAVHAVDITPVRLGDTAVVVGAGMIGLLTIQAAINAGCTTVFAIDLDDAKLALAKKLGAADGFNPKHCDAAAEVVKRTGGKGADIVLEAVGATEPVKTALAAVRKGGTVTLIGNITPKIELNLQSVVTREVRLQGTCGSNGEYPACIDLLVTGRIKVNEIISAKVSLDDAPSAFNRLYNHEPNLMKVIVQP